MAQPVALGLGALLTAFNNPDSLEDVQPVEWKNWLGLRVNHDEPGAPLSKAKISSPRKTKRK